MTPGQILKMLAAGIRQFMHVPTCVLMSHMGFLLLFFITLYQTKALCEVTKRKPSCFVIEGDHVSDQGTVCVE